MEEKYIELGRLLKEARDEQGYSRNALATKIGISSTELKRVEDGKAPSLNTLINIVNELNIDIRELLFLADLLKINDELNDIELCNSCEYYCPFCDECTYDE